MGTRDAGIESGQVPPSPSRVMRSSSIRPGASQVSIAVIGPDDFLRLSLLDALHRCFAGAVHEFCSYPPKLVDVNNLLDQRFEIVMIELDSDPDYALEIIRAVGAGGSSTVMVYSRMPDAEVPDSDLLLRCMRLGAREFVNQPFADKELKEALERAAMRQTVEPEPENVRGRLLVFCGAKGGAGVTNIACNFAIALARHAPEKTLLIDMDLPLGDAALNLGIRPRYSTIDALQNYSRIDSSFLSKLVVRHNSSLAVLPAPGRFPAHPATNEAIDRLLRVARQDFDNVVVDAGSKFDLANGCVEYKEATILYLVTQSGIPELRNANRLIAQYQSLEGPTLEIVLNRYERGSSGISEEDLKRALTCPISWRIPNDYKAVRKMQDTSAPVVETNCPMSRQIEAMVCKACGVPATQAQPRESGWRAWFGSGRKRVGPSELSAGSQLGLIEDADQADDGHAESLACSDCSMPGEEQCVANLDSRRLSPWSC